MEVIKMDELRIRLIIESIKVLDTVDDFEMRELFKKALAEELQVKLVH
jgi:hypothetical protein